MGRSNLQKRRRVDMAPPTLGPLPDLARVRKPGLASSAPPPPKRLRPATAAPAAPAASPAGRSVARPGTQARISDMLAADRRRRAASTVRPPAIVTGAPHMDSRRPPPPPRNAPPVAAAPAVPTGPAAVSGAKPPRPSSALAPSAAPRSRPPAAAARPSERPVLAAAASGKISASGGEALRYDRSLLPDKHNTLLEMLTGLEQAASLLAARRAVPDFAAVRKIVASATKRTFTLRHLSQLAALVPEAVAVLPPREQVKLTTARSRAAAASAATVSARRNDRLIIRLDDVTDLVNGATARAGCSADAAARARRRLLHARLLEHTRDWHARLLRREAITGYAGSLWHPKFRPDKHVADLPAPPLYPQAPPSPPAASTAALAAQSQPPPQTQPRPQRLSAVDDLLLPPPSEASRSSAAPAPVSGPKRAASDLPKDLLERVLARQAAKAVRAEGAEEAAERLLLHRLPATLDAVRSILSVGRRSAMGWAALVSATTAMHPGKWSAAEVEKQLEAIAKLASAWCEKKALTGPRGGHSFRVTADGNFARARAALVAARAVPADPTV